jgi:hypothetical protein
MSNSDQFPRPDPTGATKGRIGWSPAIGSLGPNSGLTCEKTKQGSGTRPTFLHHSVRLDFLYNLIEKKRRRTGVTSVSFQSRHNFVDVLKKTDRIVKRFWQAPFPNVRFRRVSVPNLPRNADCQNVPLKNRDPWLQFGKQSQWNLTRQSIRRLF